MIQRLTIIFLAIMALAAHAAAQDADTTAVEMDEVVVVGRQSMLKMRGTAANTELISASDLRRAACCNLGESFTNNPSVDVSYNDAATGTRQIRLLGLSGSYVQMMTENVPAMRGAASPFGLGYIAGPWIQSIQVSKGAGSVKNGFESVTGQINIEMRKPQADPSVSANAYVDLMGKAEANADANVHLSDTWSTALLLHGEEAFEAHDRNGDGFADMPRTRQLAAMSRWAYLGSHYVFQAALKGLSERRRSGQIGHHAAHIANPYLIDVETDRAELFTKNAYIFDRDNDGNIALIASADYHNMHAGYGPRTYSVIQRQAYLSAMFERKWTDLHALSAGLSMVYDNYRQMLPALNAVETAPRPDDSHESTPGAYVQYTYHSPDSRIIAMAGMRVDHSSRYGAMYTPRMHLRYTPVQQLTLQASAGRGYRSPHAMAEYHYLLASSRAIYIDPDLQQERAWNAGVSANGHVMLGSRRLGLAAEYYYTHFDRQMVLDLDADAHAAIITNLAGRSFSHTIQTELTFDILSDLAFTAAWRLTDVRTDYGRGLVTKPLTSRSKALFTLAWTPMMGIWAVDINCSIDGSGRNPLPDRYAPLWQERYHGYAQLNAQITRSFRHWSVYIGGENITGYRQRNPIVGADDPFGPTFDATLIHAPLHGALFYAGFRYNFTKY